MSAQPVARRSRLVFRSDSAGLLRKESNTLWVGGIPHTATKDVEAQIRQAFGQFGDVRRGMRGLCLAAK
jgi:hypothetical protein